ncbi:hypothetical protein Neosp_007722 [[Neocosmospora] mangrovei]
MEEQPDHPEPEDRGRGNPSGIQQVFVATDVERSCETRISSIFSNPQETAENTDSDTDTETVPSDSDNSKPKDSDQDHNGKKGGHRDEDDRDKLEEDDRTQYDRFQKDIKFTTQASFPVSERSVECHCFNESLQDLVTCLTRSNTKCISIDCLGRRWISERKESRIRTTVVVSFSAFPDRAEELRRDLRMAMKGNGLPVEFIKGRVTGYVTDPFGVRKQQHPLVCGSSCGPHGVSAAGTVGGFITIDGDPNQAAVYAVTNHHVVAEEDEEEEEISWTTEQNIETHLGLTEQQSEDLADLGLNKKYGDDRKTYLRDFVRQALEYWNEYLRNIRRQKIRRHRNNRIGEERQEEILDSINEELSTFIIPDQRTQHRQTYWSAITDNGLVGSETHIMEDMRWFLKPHYYELQIALRIIVSLPELNGSGIALFEHFIRIRRLQRDRPKLSRIIEHPASMDLESVIDSVKRLVPASGRGPIMPQGDAEKLHQELQSLEDHKKSAARLIGMVWASSGIGDRETTQEFPLPFREDWALIKLFQANGQKFQNQFTANLLRPDFPGQSFTGVRKPPDPVCIDVTKRGRTTDLTAGIANGAPSVVNEDGDWQMTFTIVASPRTEQFFSADGDSGSWIMDRTGQLVGMMWGGRKRFLSTAGDMVVPGDLAGDTPQDLEVEDVTYFTPASFFFRWIEESFEAGMHRLKHNLGPRPAEGRVKLFVSK